MTELLLATHNLNARTTRTKPRKTQADIEDIMSTYMVLGTQEAGDAKTSIQRAAVAAGCEVYRGEGKFGQGATPIIYRSDLEVFEAGSFPLTPTKRVGPAGAGPEVMKAKYVNYIRFKFEGRVVTFANFHATSSTYIPVRARLARRQFSGVASLVGSYKGLKFIVGDMNKEPGSKYFDPFLDRRLTSSQIELGTKNTLGRRAIDDIYFLHTPKRCTPLWNETRVLTSDHKLYGAAFDITPREVVVE